MITQSTTVFDRDYKRVKKQGKNPDLLREIVDLLVSSGSLPEKYKDHPLGGNWKGCRGLHIKPDWLLIYRVADNILFLERTGSHAELF